MDRDGGAALLRIKDELFAARATTGTFTCVACDSEALDATLTPVEGRGTLYVACRSCGYVDHVSRLPVPEWAVTREDEG